jgi:hypothetical protein
MTGFTGFQLVHQNNLSIYLKMVILDVNIEPHHFYTWPWFIKTDQHLATPNQPWSCHKK